MPYGFYKSLIVEEDWPVSRSKYFMCRKSSGINTVSYRARSKNGTVKFVFDRFTGITDTRGKLLAIEGEIVEEASYLEQVMTGELKAYRDAIDVNTIASITDRRGTILYANDMFCSVSKYSREELVGQNHRIINSGHHPKEYFAEMWRTIVSGKPWQGEVQNKAKDGSLYWVDSVIIPITNIHGKITRFLSLRQLITDRKEAEKKHKLYIQALEEMAFTVSHRFRGPVCTILGLVDLMTNYPDHAKQNDRELLEHLVNSSRSLEELTRQLTSVINQYEDTMGIGDTIQGLPVHRRMLTDITFKAGYFKED